jgi:hypothetical protein
MSPTRIGFLVPLFLAADLAVTAYGQTPASLSEIRIVSPTNGETFSAPADILVTIEGTDIPNVGHGISLYKDNELVHAIALDPLIPTTTKPVQFRFDFSVNNLLAGHYVLTATIDSIHSAPVHILVRHRRHRGR